MTNHQSIRGLNLIELSIALVIIGILAGAVIIGRDLLESARVRVSIKDREMVIAAVNVFKERYDCTPGDCPNLTDFWKDASLDTSDTYCGAPWWGSGAPLPPNSVCNGNGDGRIEWGFPTAGNAEVHGFWHQLALSGLFTKANYTGSRIRSNGAAPYAADNWPFSVRGGVNAPESPMGDNVCWSVLSTSNDPPNNPRQDTFQPDAVENIFTLGSSVNLPTGYQDYCYNPGFSSAMAFYFDSKVDDGKPGTGLVQGWLSVLTPRTPDCLVLNTANPVGEPGLPEYNLKKDGPICSLIFRDRI